MAARAGSGGGGGGSVGGGLTPEQGPTVVPQPAGLGGNGTVLEEPEGGLYRVRRDRFMGPFHWLEGCVGATRTHATASHATASHP